MADDDSRCRSPASESSLVGYEIAPGIGSVLPNNNEDNAESFKTSSANIDINSTDGVSKKVCVFSYWAFIDFVSGMMIFENCRDSSYSSDN